MMEKPDAKYLRGWRFNDDKQCIELDGEKNTAVMCLGNGLWTMGAPEWASACVNAFDGCPDPKKFMEAAKRIKVLNEKLEEALYGDTKDKCDAEALSEEISEILENSDFAWLKDE